jgi:hypothetical protein
MVLVQVVLATSTVLPTGGNLPLALGLQSPDQTTLQTLSSVLPLLSSQSLMIWMRN